jgi:hypothetical protein
LSAPLKKFALDNKGAAIIPPVIIADVLTKSRREFLLFIKRVLV